MSAPATSVQQPAPRPASGLVWLASYPKSGNTWTRTFLHNLVKAIAGEDDAQDINAINRFSTGELFLTHYKDVLGFEPTEAHRKEIAAARHPVQQRIADEHDGVVFIKTHHALVMDRGHSTINFAVTSGAIYIVRNPLDVAISLSYHINKSIDDAIVAMATRDAETPVNEKQVNEIWGSWSQHVESWTRKPHRAIYVMRYEDMLNEPEKTFGGLARHLLLDATPAQLADAIDKSSFEKLQAQEEKEGFRERPEHAERFFREGRAGQWKEILTPTQIDQIAQDHHEQMARFGYLPT